MSVEIVQRVAQMAGHEAVALGLSFHGYWLRAPDEFLNRPLANQWQIFMSQYEPKTDASLIAGRRIADLIETYQLHETQQRIQQHSQQRQAQHEPDQSTQAEIASAIAGRVIDGPFHALVSLLQLGGVAAGAAAGAARGVVEKVSVARMASVSKRADQAFSAMQSSVMAFVALPRAIGGKALEAAEKAMEYASSGYARAAHAESRSLLKKACTGDVSREEVTRIVEERADDAEKLLEQALSSVANSESKSKELAILGENFARVMRDLVASVVAALRGIFGSVKRSHP
ncbi:MAG: hypothetical protein JWR21_4357 [Herminiimonas sp.]|nr:hypothetical protein [Herminiimonas sp.]